MKFESLITGLCVARQPFNLTTTDLFILNEIFCADNNTTTIMKIVGCPFASRATIHARLKKLCAAGFLIKKEDPKNMRHKTVEPGDVFKDFLRKLGEVE